jgi:hypothetical protein
MTDPEHLRRRAAALRAAAKTLETNGLFGIRQQMGPHVWQVPQAAAFDDDLRRHEEALRAALHEINAAAQHLMTEADQLETKGRAL